MPDVSKDLILLLQYLLPGFMAAWVYYEITSHVKPSQFERVVQALIFSAGVKILVIPIQACLLYLGRWHTVGAWDADAALCVSLVIAIVIGFYAAILSNKDYFHDKFRKWGISKRTGNPSEWYSALDQYPRFIVLHLKDDRRLFGWPGMWPSDPEKGHFFITNPVWLSDDKAPIEMSSCEGILINVADVQWIEFSKPPEGQGE